MQPGQAATTLIQSFETCAKKRADGFIEAYPDPEHASGDPWTIGWGSTGPDIHKGTVWTQQMCDARFASDLKRCGIEVSTLISDAPTTQNQFDAMVSFHYNTGALGKSTLLRLHRAGNYAAAKNEFGKWINAGGHPSNGLIRRRAAEAALYAKG